LFFTLEVLHHLHCGLKGLGNLSPIELRRDQAEPSIQRDSTPFREKC